MYRSLAEFLELWDFEYSATQRILDRLTDESLSQAVTVNDRTIGRIAWHIVLSVHIIVSRTGLEFESPDESTSVPQVSSLIADTYRQVNDHFLKALKAQWTDESLGEHSAIAPEERWENRRHLLWLINHQIHHRGQLTVLMRQAGLTVPGTYGPSREELASLGFQQPTV